MTAVPHCLEVLADRRSERLKDSKSPPRDPYHVALVIEGGAMRGVTVGGMVSALEVLGLTNCFDSVHGSSAGAAAGAYFLTGQAQVGTALFYDDLSGRQFINRLNPFLAKPIVDVDYLVDVAMVRKKPFDFEGLQRCKTALWVICTDIDAGEAYAVSTFASYEYYREVLKASIRMPLFGGRETRVDGRRLLDGGLVQHIALDSAVRVGATHIVALLTRREDEIVRTLPGPKTCLESQFLQCLYGGRTGRLYYQRNIAINDQVAQILRGATHTGVPIWAVTLPSDITYVHRLTTERSLLERAAIESFDHTISQLSTVANYSST